MRPLWRHLGRARRRTGQAAVFVALILFSLVIMLALATNIGIVVNDKIRMQNTADLATYAAAYSEAQVLNNLTFLNTQIADAVSVCRASLTAAPYVDCLCQYRSPIAEAQVQGCKALLDPLIMRFVIAASYPQSVTQALDRGYNTAEANFSGIRSQTSFMEWIPNSPTFPTQYWLNYQTHYMGGMSIPAIANYSQATNIQVNYTHITLCPGPNCACCMPQVYFPPNTLNGWFYKSNADPEIWVEGRVYGTPLKQFLDVAYSGGYFGSSATGGDDLLYAYAVAKPYEGSVGPTQIGDKDANGFMAGPLYVPWGSNEVNLGMQEQYRARLAGMNESLEGASSPTSLAQWDGFMLGKVWNVGYFKH
ncbi:MAG: Tad domain-containing protein [Pseudomonadota bacterium]